MTRDDLVTYLVGALVRAEEAYSPGAAAGTRPALALGEALALFNLADEFGVVAEVRRIVDEERGHDVYARLSEAMKAYLLGQASRPPDPRPSPSANRGRRPPAPRTGRDVRRPPRQA